MFCRIPFRKLVYVTTDGVCGTWFQLADQQTEYTYSIWYMFCRMTFRKLVYVMTDGVLHMISAGWSATVPVQQRPVRPVWKPARDRAWGKPQGRRPFDYAPHQREQPGRHVETIPQWADWDAEVYCGQCSSSTDGRTTSTCPSKK